MNEERDRFLIDAMGWTYEGHRDGAIRYRSKYGYAKENSYAVAGWGYFGMLWEWAQDQEWWADFMSRDVDAVDFFEELINPDRFADAIYLLLKEGIAP